MNLLWKQKIELRQKWIRRDDATKQHLHVHNINKNHTTSIGISKL